MRLGDHHIEQDGKMFITLERHDQIRNADQGRAFWCGAICVVGIIYALWVFGVFSCAHAQGLPIGSSTGPVFITSGQTACQALPNAICTIKFQNGQVTTEGCDFSRDLKNPKISPLNERSLRMDFEQLPSTVGTCK